ncbi:MAG: efflux RND transporter permease subunit, partial [Bryobacteraceae bacterium]
MNIARITLQKPVLTWLFALICLVGGLVGYFNLGQLEDPSFTIKQAYVFTPYPGAVAAEVEAEFTEKVESVIQQMPQIKRLTSRSMHGVSEVSIEVLDSVAASDLPQVWDELRKRLRDMEHTLPPGAQAPIVNDDFADVYGIYYAVTGDGLTYRELDDLGREIRKELLAIPGVAKVSVSGVVPEELVVA